MVQSPQVVRDIDWLNQCWPDDRKQEGQFPKVRCAFSGAAISIAGARPRVFALAFSLPMYFHPEKIGAFRTWRFMRRNLKHTEFI